MKHSLFIFLFLLLFTVSCKKSTTLVQNLHDQNKVENAYHLYPSTLRMLNFVDVESINKLVKDVEKLTLMMMDADSFGYEQMFTFSNDLQKKEAYDLYLELEDEERQLYILGKESPDKTIFLITYDDRQFVVDMIGRPNFMELPRAMNDLTALDSTETNGFSMLKDLMDQDAHRKERRRESRRKWEEKQKEEAAALEFKRDSILQDSIKLIN